MDTLSDVIEERLVAGTLEVPVLPAVASRVLALLADANPDPRELGQLTRGDPVLAAHIIRVANCPSMRSPAPVTDVNQAVARLGLRRVGEIALAASLGPRLFKAPPYAAVIDRTWMESLAAAGWAQELSRLLRTHADSAFLCGLLARIGEPVVLAAVVALAGTNAPPARDIGVLLERHSRLAGTRVGKAWNLPAPVTECMLWLRQVEYAVQQSLVALVDAAVTLAPFALDAEAEPDPAALAARREFRLCGLDAGTVATVLTARAGIATMVQAMVR